MIDKKFRIFKVDETTFKNYQFSDYEKNSLGIDITPLFKEMFGKNLPLQRAFILCDKMLNRSDVQIIADNILNQYNKNTKRDYKMIDFGAEEIFFELKDGSVFRLYSSEWGTLSKIN